MFFGILLVTLSYSWLTLTGSVIRGVAHTAPFSPWSFGYYLGQTLPLICLGELFFLAFFSSKEERLLRPLIQATPVKQRQYIVMRCGIVFIATILICLFVIALAVGFYVSLFGWMHFGELLLPTLLTVLPPVVFCLGAGLVLSRFSHILIYVLMVTVLILSVIPLPPAVSLSLSNFFSQYPLHLNELDPAFYIPSWIIISKIIFMFLGLALVVFDTNMRDGQHGLFKECFEKPRNETD